MNAVNGMNTVNGMNVIKIKRNMKIQVNNLLTGEVATHEARDIFVGTLARGDNAAVELGEIAEIIDGAASLLHDFAMSGKCDDFTSGKLDAHASTVHNVVMELYNLIN